MTYYGAAPQATYDYETRKRGYDALDDFFGSVKRREINPVDYQAVARRLFELQGLQLPQIIPSTMSVPAYQPVSSVGGYGSEDPVQAYSLPPMMSNTKTRSDLASIDRILEQMQATIYDNDTALHTNQTSPSYLVLDTQQARHSPSNGQQPPMSAHQHTPSISDASTPGLTPPSSAHSYTSGGSPLPMHTTPGTAAYPTLPASNVDHAGMAQMSSYYQDPPNRYMHGSNLHKAQPNKSDIDMADRSDGSATPPASQMNKQLEKGKAKEESPGDHVIDPALSGSIDQESEDKENNAWLQQVRLVEWLREFVKKRMEEVDAEDTASDGMDVKSEPKSEHIDTEMSDETLESELKRDEQQLYPVLQSVVEQDA